MDKQQALYNFWSGFGIPAYDENTVPDNATLPYITYNVVTDSFGNATVMSASIWAKTTSWTYLDRMADTISQAIGRGGVTLAIDDGMIWISRSSSFAQRMSDDGEIKRTLLQITAEYITQN